MEKMVPTDTFTSMLDEPSSGSVSTMYFALRFFSLSKAMKFSSSSDAKPATSSRAKKAALIVLCANTSSFFCCSPCTFSAPASPRIS